MNEYAILAFVVMPIVAVFIGVAAMLLHGREADRLERQRDRPALS